MKSTIALLFSLLLIVSCGEKKDSGKVGFKVLLGRAIDGSDRFPGGLLIMGRHIDGGHSFTLKYTPDLELTLPKGPWEFAAVGWESNANGPMTGNHLCAYNRLELRDDFQSIAFFMNADSCINTKASGGEEFSDSQYLIQTAGSSTVGFKKLIVEICSSIDTVNRTCSSGFGTRSIRIGVIPEVKNILLAGSAPALISACLPVNSGSSTISTALRIPYGGENGFINFKVESFSDSTCATYKRSFYFPHGFQKTMGTVAMMSPSHDPALSYRFIGSFDSWTAVPTTGLSKGDIYNDIPSNQYKMYNSSSWISLPSGVSVVNGRVYDANNEPHLFLAE